MNRVIRKATTLFTLTTIVVAFFINPVLTLAATVTDQPVANYSSSWYLSRFGGLHWTIRVFVWPLNASFSTFLQYVYGLSSHH